MTLAMAAEAGAPKVAAGIMMSSGSMSGEMGMMQDFIAWWLPFEGLLALAILATLIVCVVVLARQHQGMVFTHHEALDVLDARYAKGELDREDYMRRKADILGQKA